MKIDITSMFFNSRIEGQTATPAWGTSIGQNKSRDCRIDDFKQEVVDMVIGMTYKSISDFDNLDISKGSSGRDVITCSVFNDIYINNKKIGNSQYVLLLVREHSKSHEGRLLISYAPYIKYKGIDNQSCIDKMQQRLGCNKEGCWFVYDISIRDQSELHFSAVVVNATAPMVYSNTIKSKNRSEEWKSLIPDNKKDFPIPKSYGNFIKALHTKPFLLLAGISGTGKSQKVQELAFMTCPEGKLRNEGGTTPGNYCLVEVKPNWHDSTELLGYYSALSGKYELTDFIRFAYKASQNKYVPFFLCLDEMNLAPVEQYFAEFLSVLETRKKVGNEIQTQYLLSKDRFSNCELQKKMLVKEDGDIIEGDKQYKMEFLYSEKDAEIITYLREKGLTLPDNLFVIGTVNMDDTTHQFSRKVIDRAFTIEMNGGKMLEMFSPESKMLLEYRDEPTPLEAFKAEFVRAYEVLENTRFAKYKDVISTRIPELLGDSDGTAEADSINGILNETPFRVSYRVQNELVLYLSTLIERANFPEPDQIEGLIGEATLAILLEKVLPRVQGEQKQLETQKGKSNVLKDLKAFVEKHFNPEEDADANSLYNQVLRKLKEMDDKLANYYTNFF